MIIEKITLENFRQFFGVQELHLSKSIDKNVTIIHGVNGAGKTSLFLGINWCLYGYYIEDENGGQGINIPGEIPSKSLINILKNDEQAKVAVEIDFIHNGERFNARREMFCYKKDENIITEFETEKFSLYKYKFSGDAEKIPNPINVINTILPQTAGKYFLFDGERIDEFASPGKEAEIRDSIWQVLGLEALQRAEDHLNKAAKRFTSIVRNYIGDELDDLLEQEEKIVNSMENNKKEIERLSKEITFASKEKRLIDNKLSQYSRISEYIENRKNLEKEQISLQTEWSNLDDDLWQAISRGALILSKSFINNSLKLLEDKRDKGEIPSNIKKQFINELIERGYCICKTPIVKDSKEHKNLIELLETVIEDSLEQEMIDANIQLGALINSCDLLKSGILDILEKRTKNTQRRIQIDKVLDEIKVIVSSASEEDIQKLEKKRTEIEDNIIEYSVNKRRINDTISDDEKELKKIRNKIAKTKSNNEKKELAKQKKVLSEKACEAINKLFLTFAEDKRIEIQNLCKNLFKNMVWKESQFTEITLTKDYKLEVFDRFAMPARWDLSAGEREILSLSFIAAMAKASGGEAPFIIDTPFGRISEKPRKNIAQHLPSMTRQLILFVTDVELTPESEKEFRTKTGKEYTLLFDDTIGVTKIVEGKHV